MIKRINWANQLTISRFIMAIFMIFFLSQDENWALILAFGLFTLASLTDALDGWLARNFYGCTSFGKLMDPLADKVLTMAAFVGLVEKGSITAWMVSLILSRELMVTGLRLFLSKKEIVLAADNWGKFKTIVQMLVITLLLGGLIWPEIGLPGPHSRLAYLLGCFAAISTVISGITYFYHNRVYLRVES